MASRQWARRLGDWRHWARLLGDLLQSPCQGLLQADCRARLVNPLLPRRLHPPSSFFLLIPSSSTDYYADGPSDRFTDPTKRLYDNEWCGNMEYVSAYYRESNTINDERTGIPCPWSVVPQVAHFFFKLNLDMLEWSEVPLAQNKWTDQYIAEFDTQYYGYQDLEEKLEVNYLNLVELLGADSFWDSYFRTEQLDAVHDFGAIVHGGRLLVVGGWEYSFSVRVKAKVDPTTASPHVFAIDLSSGQAASLGEPPEARGYRPPRLKDHAIVSAGGMLYALGGDEATYNGVFIGQSGGPREVPNEVTPLQVDPAGLYYGAVGYCSYYYDYFEWCANYADGSNGGAEPYYQEGLPMLVAVFDSYWNFWTELEIPGGGPANMHGLSASLVGEEVVVVGGQDKFGVVGAQFSDAVWALHTGNHSWRWVNTTSNFAGRHLHGALAIGETIYVFGGWGVDGSVGGSALGDLWALHVPSAAWQSLSASASGPPPAARYDHAMTEMDGIVFVYGGRDAGGGLLSDMVQLDVATLTWTVLVSHTAQRGVAGHSLVAIAGRLFAFGGQRPGTEQGIPVAILEEFSFGQARWEDTRAPGNPPPAMWGQAVAVLGGGRVVAYGGQASSTAESAPFNSLYYLPLPRQPTARFLGADIASIFDGDTLVIASGAALLLNKPFELGDAANFIIRGESPGASIERHGSGGLSCFEYNACSSLHLKNLAIRCHDSAALAALPPIQVSGIGTSVTLDSVSIEGCRNSADGGAVRAVQGSNLTVRSSSFDACHSAGNGGAIAIAGAELLVVDSRFERCSAAADGGAVYASTDLTYQTEGGLRRQTTLASSFEVDACSFLFCNASRGGALAAVGVVGSSIARTSFLHNAATQEGGAVRMEQANIRLEGCQLDGNHAGVAGGALHWHGRRPDSDVPDDGDASALCGAGINTAGYGPCLSSNASSLRVAQSQSMASNASGAAVPAGDLESRDREAPLSLAAAPGIGVEVSIWVLDAYGQVVTADSSSMIEAQRPADPNMMVLEVEGGAKVVSRGEASLSLSARPTYSSEGPAAGPSVPALALEVQLLALASGGSSGGEYVIATPRFQLRFEAGAQVCPRGSILIVEQRSLAAGHLVRLLSPLPGGQVQRPPALRAVGTA